MALKQGKERVQISLTHEQVKQIEKTASGMGLSKSDLIAIATMQYISSFELSKDITKSALSDAITRALKEGDIDIERIGKLYS